MKTYVKRNSLNLFPWLIASEYFFLNKYSILKSINCNYSFICSPKTLSSHKRNENIEIIENTNL